MRTHTPSPRTRPLPPVNAAVIVDTPIEQAFHVFADELGRWWPNAYTYAASHLETAAIEPRVGGRWFERDDEGRETSWGEVRAYERPHRIVAAFAIGPRRSPESPEKASEVEFRFFPEKGGSRTRLEVEHRDFARHGSGAAELRAGMASHQGWSLILAAFAREATR